MPPAFLDEADTERTSAFAPRAIEAARILAERALERAARGDSEVARAAIQDAFVLLDAADHAGLGARVSVVLGEALLFLDEAQRAKACFAAALHVLEMEDDGRAKARALVGLRRALRIMEDATTRDAPRPIALRSSG